MERARPLGGSIFCSLPVRTRVGPPPLRLGSGGPVSQNACSSTVWWYFWVLACSNLCSFTSLYSRGGWKKPNVEVRLTHGVIGPDADITERRRRPAPHRRSRSEHTKRPAPHHRTIPLTYLEAVVANACPWEEKAPKRRDRPTTLRPPPARGLSISHLVTKNFHPSPVVDTANARQRRLQRPLPILRSRRTPRSGGTIGAAVGNECFFFCILRTKWCPLAGFLDFVIHSVRTFRFLAPSLVVGFGSLGCKYFGFHVFSALGVLWAQSFSFWAYTSVLDANLPFFLLSFWIRLLPVEGF